MARSIKSPGVQITEIDQSFVQQTATGTNVLVAGFASQGPTDQILKINSISELESVFGTPTTPPERYFYHTCRQVLESPGTLNVSRLPYGENAGDTFATQYSMLLYPTMLNPGEFEINKPVHISLSDSEYYSIKEGNINWVNTACTTGTLPLTSYSLSSITVLNTPIDITNATNEILILDPDWVFDMDFVTVPGSVVMTFDMPIITTIDVYGATHFYDPMTGITDICGGLLILNDSQTIVNHNFEGYYVSLTDNSQIGPDSDYKAVTSLYSLTADNTFYDVSKSRLTFELDAPMTAPRDSVSEMIERTQTYYFADDYYKDSVLLNVFKVYRSSNEPQKLNIQLMESYAGSLDFNKKELPTGGSGTSRSYFLENVVNEKSPNITVLVNPSISKTNWVNLITNTPDYRTTIASDVKALYPKGVFKPLYNTAMDRKLGNIPLKLARALRIAETPESLDLDVVVDGGLSTIHAAMDTATELYDDALMVPTGSILGLIVSRWKVIFDTFNTYAKETRKDCVFISDPFRNIFVNGNNVKTMSKKTSSFSDVIFTPLRQSYAGVNCNYSVAYGNWVRVNDVASDTLFWAPFSGFAAAIYCRTDYVAHPWIAPAGLTRGTVDNVIDIAFNPKQKERDDLYTISVNPVVFFVGDGYTIFGQKTLQNKPSAFDRINVRRLFLSLEKSVLKTAKYFVFEPNTVTTRSRLVNTIVPIFELAKSTEGVYDYLIVCDERNNTAITIDNNELVVDIYIKPVRAAEFILINFIATRTSQSFQELL